MRQLSNIETAILLIGGLLMVVGAGALLFLQSWAPWIYAPGALMFAAMQLRQRYEGNVFTIRRLRRIMLLSDVLFLVSAVLMFAGQQNIFGLDHLTYLQYVYNKWVVTLLIAAILQLYSTHRIGSELEREAKKL